MTRRRAGGHIRLIDRPRPSERETYNHAIEKTVGVLSAQSFVDSVYQVGGVRHPGISDIDLLVVVDDAAASDADPLERLTAEERYLFTHACFLVPVSLAPELATYTLITGYRLLYGTSWGWEGGADDTKTTEALGTQTALEFLAKNLLDLFVQIEYRIVKVRVLLQHLKGLELDLALLEIEDADLRPIVEAAAGLTESWFLRPDAEQAAAELAIDLLRPLYRVVVEATARQDLYSPSGSTISFARNMTIDNASTVSLSRYGVRLPRLPGIAERRSFNAQHRFNRFRFALPMTKAPTASYQENRFRFLALAKSFANSRFPAYSAPVPPLFYRAL